MTGALPSALLTAGLVAGAVALTLAPEGLSRRLGPGRRNVAPGSRHARAARATHRCRIGRIRRALAGPDGEDERAAVLPAVERLVTLLRAGLPTGQAWQLAVPPSASSWQAGALRAAAGAAGVGEDPASQLRAAVRSAPAPRRFAGHRAREHHERGVIDLSALAVGCAVSARSGAPLGAVLQGLVSGLRDRAEGEQSRQVALAGPRSSARVVSCLPVMGVGLGTMLGADPVKTLLFTTGGRLCAVLGVGIALLGWCWSRHLVRTAAAPRMAGMPR